MKKQTQQGLPSTSRHSARLGAETRILDEATKRQRIRKHLEALERDNVHDDPHANIVWNKAVPKFADELVYHNGGGASDASTMLNDSGSGMSGKTGRKRKSALPTDPHSTPNGDVATKKGKKLRAELAKTRFRKTFAQLLEEEERRVGSEEPDVLLYADVVAPPSRQPHRKFCAICGQPSRYNCVRCATRFCSMRCRDVHVDTRCLKWTA